MASVFRELVQHKIRSSELPAGAERVWAGPGTETPCKGCRVPTKVTGTEFELVAADGRSTTICRPCYLIWSEETRKS